MFHGENCKILNQARRPALAWFLEITLVCALVCVCVCVCVVYVCPEGINNQWRDMARYRPCVIGQTRSTAFPCLQLFNNYDTCRRLNGWAWPY